MYLTRNGLFAIMVLYIGFSRLLAQPVQPCIFTNDTVGCAPFTVNMINCTNSKTGIRYNFIDNLVDNYFDNTIHTYQQPGNYTIRQIITVSVSQGSNSAVKKDYIRVKGRPTPQFNLVPCEDFKVKVVIIDTNYQQFTIDFGDGNIAIIKQNESVIHQFTDSGVKTIKVDALYVPGGCGTSTTKSVETFDKLVQPTILGLISTLNPSLGVNLLFANLTNTSNYVVGAKPVTSTNFVSIDTLINQSGEKSNFYVNNRLDEEVFCYQLANVDGCGNSLKADHVPCSILLEAKSENNQITLNWKLGNGDLTDKIEVFRNGIKIKEFIGGLDTAFIDTTVQCGKKYCYKINQINSKGTVSKDTCLDAISTKVPGQVVNSNATVNDSNIKLSWQANTDNTLKEYRIFKSTNNQPFALVNKQLQTEYIDKQVGFSNTTLCYQVDYVDSCGKESIISNVICPSLLSYQYEPNGDIKLEWTNYSSDYPLATNAYKLVRVDQNLNPIKEIYFGANTIFIDNEKDTINQIKRYIVMVYTANQSNPISYSNPIEINQGGTLYFPNAFTPNGDGLNDVFLPKGRFVKSYKIGVYGRWGDLIFTSNEVNKGWDGQGFPAGIYQYVVSFEDFLGNKKTQKGFITILE